MRREKRTFSKDNTSFEKVLYLFRITHGFTCLLKETPFHFIQRSAES